MTKSIALFYGSSTCYTEMAAEKIQAAIGADRVELFNIADENIETMLAYDLLILGIPTWDYGELQEDWENCWDELDELDLSGKRIGLFGLGDQVGYPQWFQDALGYLHDKIVGLGATAVAYWPAEGYEFEQSKALTQDGSMFVGLALDEENEFELTEQRIKQWTQTLLSSFDK
ncbi:flavodoxin FldB [Agaribacterium haliotis]|uniref:flavodoxin FldB n=1 Tax=Agaribacterium haliotis TaxID=2013869 RepID=UPI000BB59ED3|nr:flavodoxin FldB [Agaribacterium haliotis]